MKFTVEVPHDFIPRDPVGVIYAIKDALEFAEIPAAIGELSDGEGIHNIFDCSTIHVTPSDMNLLCSMPGEGRSTEVLAYPNEYGAFVYVPGSPEIGGDFKSKEDYLAVLRSDGFSESFLKVMELASIRNCVWIKFDCDGHVWDELDNRDGDWR